MYIFDWFFIVCILSMGVRGQWGAIQVWGCHSVGAILEWWVSSSGSLLGVSVQWVPSWGWVHSSGVPSGGCHSMGTFWGVSSSGCLLMGVIQWVPSGGCHPVGAFWGLSSSGGAMKRVLQKEGAVKEPPRSVNKRVVHILLECFLVLEFVFNSCFSAWQITKKLKLRNPGCTASQNLKIIFLVQNENL